MIGAMSPWRTKCYECEEESGITTPRYANMFTLLDGDLQKATAYYATHRRVDGKSCPGGAKTVPRYQMRSARSTTPDAQEDQPTIARA